MFYSTKGVVPVNVNDGQFWCGCVPLQLQHQRLRVKGCCGVSLRLECSGLVSSGQGRGKSVGVRVMSSSLMCVLV